MHRPIISVCGTKKVETFVILLVGNIIILNVQKNWIIINVTIYKQNSTYTTVISDLRSVPDNDFTYLPGLNPELLNHLGTLENREPCVSPMVYSISHSHLSSRLLHYLSILKAALTSDRHDLRISRNLHDYQTKLRHDLIINKK